MSYVWRDVEKQYLEQKIFTRFELWEDTITFHKEWGYSISQYRYVKCWGTLSVGYRIVVAGGIMLCFEMCP